VSSSKLFLKNIFYWEDTTIRKMSSIISSIQSLVIGTDKKALLLGAGFVTKPTVEILAKNGVEVTVGA